jgi:hypothetical protein
MWNCEQNLLILIFLFHSYFYYQVSFSLIAKLLAFAAAHFLHLKKVRIYVNGSSFEKVFFVAEY